MHVQSNSSVINAVCMVKLEDGSNALSPRIKPGVRVEYVHDVLQQNKGNQLGLVLQMIVLDVTEVLLPVQETYTQLKKPRKSKSASPKFMHLAAVEPLADVVSRSTCGLFLHTVKQGKIRQQSKLATVVAICMGA